MADGFEGFLFGTQRHGTPGYWKTIRLALRDAVLDCY